jgi:hypothetical protein
MIYLQGHDKILLTLNTLIWFFTLIGRLNVIQHYLIACWLNKGE